MAERPLLIPTKPSGKSGIEIYSNQYTDDFFQKENSCRDVIRLFSRMGDDPQCRKILLAIKNPIKSANWSIDEGTEEGINLEAKELLEQIFFKDMSWKEKLDEILTFLDFGHSVFEPVQENRNDGELGDYTGLSSLAWRNQSTLKEWDHDKVTGRLKRIKQEQSGDIEIDTWLDVDSLILFFNEKKGDDNGVSLLRYLYKPWRRKQLTQQMKMVGIERFAIGVPKVKVPPGLKREEEEFSSLVSEMRDFVNGRVDFLIHPSSFEVDLWNNSGFDPIKLETSIKRENEEMAGTILASFFELGTGGNGGAYALGENLERVFSKGIGFFADYIAQVVNVRLIPALMKMNFGDKIKTMPTLMHSGISEKSGKEFMEIVTGFKNAGLITPQENDEIYLREKYNLPKKEEGEDEPNPAPEPALPIPIPGMPPMPPALPVPANSIPTTLNSAMESMTMVEKENYSTMVLNTRKLINNSSDEINETLEKSLKAIGIDMVGQIIKNYKKLSEVNSLQAIDDLKHRGAVDFRKILQQVFVDIAGSALEQVIEEVPSTIGLNLKTQSIQLREFKNLPKHVRLLLKRQLKRISDKSINDLEDALAFQFMQTSQVTNDYRVIQQDLEGVVDSRITEKKLVTASTNAAATIINQTRTDYFFTPEVTEKIYAFVFNNVDPISAICKRLAGRVFAKNDREFLSYSPPLHHNCKSFLSSIPVGGRKPKIKALPPITEAQRDSITFNSLAEKIR